MCAKSVVGSRLYLCADLDGICLRRLRHRRLQSPDRGLAGRQIDDHRPGPRRGRARLLHPRPGRQHQPEGADCSQRRRQSVHLGGVHPTAHRRRCGPLGRLRSEHAFFTRAQEGNTNLKGLIAHSDAGSQYTSVAFTQRLIDEGVDPSVGSVGDALDNALAETTVGSFKNELIRRQGPWRDVNQVELATAEWVVWFNTERPHEYLDDFTPEAVEKLHYDHRRTPPKAE